MSSTRSIIQKKVTVPQNCFYFTASVPLQNYLHKFKDHPSTALNISQLVTVDRKSRKRFNLSIMLLGHHRVYFQWHERHFIHKYLQDLFRQVHFMIINK